MKKRLMMVILIGVVALPPYTRAAENTLILDDMVVTGTRHEQKTEKIPAQVTVITAQEIRESGAQDVPDALRGMGGVLVTDLNGNGNNQMVDMGGFGETADRHVAVLINGRRINNADQSAIRWSSIPVENIEKIEVLHGSGSVLYGDCAMGGVINIITKEWDDEERANLELSGGSHITRKGHADFSLGNRKANALFSVTRFSADGYRERSALNRQNIFGKFRVEASDALSLFAEGSATKANFEFPSYLTKAELNQDRRQVGSDPFIGTPILNDEGTDEDSSATLGFEADLKRLGLLTANLYHRQELRDSDMASWWSFITFDIRTTGTSWQYVLDHALLDRQNRLTLGVDFADTRYDAVGGAFKGATTNQYAHRKKSLGLYGQDEIGLTDNLLLNLGARYENPSLDLSKNGNETSVDQTEWAWNLGLAWRFRPGSKLFSRVYRSFRFPVVDEYMNLTTGAVNTNLSQETAIGYEIGGRFVLTERMVANIRGFILDVDNQITWNSNTNQNENLDKTRHTGGNLDLRFRALDWLTLFSAAGLTEAKFTQGAYKDKIVPLVPQFKGNAGAEMQFDFGLKVRIQANYVGEQYFGSDNANAMKKMDGYTTADLYLSQQIKKVECFLNATNLFGEEYSDAGYYRSWTVPPAYTYYPMPEAVYFGGVRVRF